MTALREFQQRLWEIYGERDVKRGAEKTLLWMLSEAGEVADAYLKRDKEELENELADLLAWLLSFCNVIGVDLEEAFERRYGNACPRCGERVCSCPQL